ncbi:hypothetical protein ACFL2I_03300 [Candidatus Omnitrophota bacterium]
MWKRLYDRKGQSTGEYALVFAIILGAIVAMQTYVKRGMQGRVKDGTDYMASETSDIGTTEQYDPYYYRSQYDTRRDSVVSDQYADGAVTKDISQEDATRQVGGFTQFDAPQ